MADHLPLNIDTIQGHLDHLTKPVGSLGKLEQIAARLCMIQQTLTPITQPRQLVVFAADHGVVEAGVTAWPSQVTTLMIGNILNGGAACSVLAQTHQTAFKLVDVGSLGPAQAPQANYRDARVARGTANLATTAAMDTEQFQQAWEVGRSEADAADQLGCKVVAAGEMGIGNTTPAACLAVLLADIDVAEAVGPGAGADAETVARKQCVVADAVTRARTRFKADPVAAMASVAGFEIVAMAGFYDRAAELGMVILVDGYITTAAALIAQHLQPQVTQSMIAAHLSAEGAHDRMLAKLGLVPLLRWQMRLGEGTGALTAMPLLDCAAAMVGRMANFSDLGLGDG